MSAWVSEEREAGVEVAMRTGEVVEVWAGVVCAGALAKTKTGDRKKIARKIKNRGRVITFIVMTVL